MIGVQFPAEAVKEFLLFTRASRQAVRPTQPPIQWVMGPISLGVKQSECEADHLPPPSAISPIRLHGIVLSEAQGQLYLLPLPISKYVLEIMLNKTAFFIHNS
jgi:hypothetical protein